MIFKSSVLLAICASPLLTYALPTAIISELESANLNVTEFENTLARRSDDACPDATGKKSKWANGDNDGHGHYTGSCGNNGSGGKGECWSDVYAVRAQVQWAPWQTVGADLDCQSSSECEIEHLESVEKCTSWSTSTGFSAGITGEMVSIGAEVTHENGGSRCTSSADTYHCKWDDKKCHKVVATYQYVRVWGYVRRTCKKPIDNGGSQKKRPDGFYTRGWTDWDAKFPVGGNVGWQYSCKYGCDQDAGKDNKGLPDFGLVKKI
ncbi:hypothetical protein N7492_004252 [Penicillium capsulatum]|uniref:Uncharacterized protein n=1 Tax=Penicillium capsulatum TaxID=69766 RepID=A0A9W9I7A1_9EURO|nr:hypothetical protein N7492_004252 [Penicillium capsulatum]KAJ6136627.1 hypothetical protein N7512_001787 [Penicillium capsulatum]